MNRRSVRWFLCFALIMGMTTMTGSFIVQAKRLPFTVGESLVYNLYYGSFLAGKQTMTVVEKVSYQGRASYKILVSMDTAGLGKLYNYQESGILYLDEEGIFPLYVRRDIEEKGQNYWTQITFDPQTKEFLKKTNKSGTEQFSSYQAKDGCQEDLSLYYYLRTRPWLREDKDFRFLTKRGPTNINFTAMRGEELVTPLGNFVTDKVENSKEGYTLWFSRDERVLPLLVKKGKITCRLIEVRNK